MTGITGTRRTAWIKYRSRTVSEAAAAVAPTAESVFVVISR